jgi:AcrR family transcriptional regulator
MNVQSARRPQAARARLLERAVEHLAAHGLSDITLRQLAAALGTSHRMLIYHFQSKEGLLVAVVQAVEASQRRALAQLFEQARGAPREMGRLFWRQLRDPALAPHERLFFELYGQALQGRPHAVPLLDGIVDNWVEPVAALLRAEGFPAGEAGAEARLGIAVTRGLLLDLLATGDAAAVDQAHEQYLAGLEARRMALARQEPAP